MFLIIQNWSRWQDLNLQPLGPKPSALPNWATSRLLSKNGALEGIRTPDLLVRSQTLYPAELRAHWILIHKKWWLRMESNHRHKDFQSSALPTELQSHIWRFRRGLNPRSSAWQADVLTTALRNHGCGGRTRTYDLRVMSPTSYQLLHPAIYIIFKKWRRKRDSNPCADCSTSRFSRPVPSTRLGYSSTSGA